MSWRVPPAKYFQLACSIGSASRSGRTDALMKGVGSTHQSGSIIRRVHLRVDVAQETGLIVQETAFDRPDAEQKCLLP